MKAGDEELREKPGAMDWGCCVGEDSGELLASDERSEALEMETSCSVDQSEALLPEGERGTAKLSLLTSVSVNRLGQNSRSSSRSKERPASNLMRNADRAADSLTSLMLRALRN